MRLVFSPDRIYFEVETNTSQTLAGFTVDSLLKIVSLQFLAWPFWPLSVMSRRFQHVWVDSRCDRASRNCFIISAEWWHIKAQSCCFEQKNSFVVLVWEVHCSAWGVMVTWCKSFMKCCLSWMLMWENWSDGYLSSGTYPCSPKPQSPAAYKTMNVFISFELFLLGFLCSHESGILWHYYFLILKFPELQKAMYGFYIFFTWQPFILVFP